MSTNEMATQGSGASAPVAKDAPTEQQTSKAGAPKRFERGQTVCNEKNEKGKLCNGHLKQVSPVREEARQHMRGDDLLYRCQTCGALYMGPPLGHVRDPRKQARYVQRELVDILEAAGGTLPAFKKSETGAWVPVSETTAHAPAAAAAQSAKPAGAAKPAPPAPAAATPPAAGGETPEQKRARIIAEAKAKAAARMAGGATAQSEAAATPTAPVAAGNAPAAAGVGDAPSGETAEERRARIMAEAKAKAAAKMAAAKGGAAAAPESPATPPPPVAANATPPAAQAAPTSSGDAVPADETPEQKRARMMAEIKAKAAAKMAAKNSASGAKVGGETSISMPPTSAQPPSPTSGTDSSAAADAHRPAAEAQAATGQASAAPMSPAAATASPAAGAETPADLAPDASTELTPGAPADERAADDGKTE